MATQLGGYEWITRCHLSVQQGSRREGLQPATNAGNDVQYEVNQAVTTVY